MVTNQELQTLLPYLTTSANIQLSVTQLKLNGKYKNFHF